MINERDVHRGLANPDSQNGGERMSVFLDGNARPKVPTDWSDNSGVFEGDKLILKVVSHKKIGAGNLVRDGNEMYFNDKKIVPYTFGGSGFYFDMKKIRKQFLRESAENANVLDALLESPALIPPSWADKAIIFIGTMYQDQFHWKESPRQHLRTLKLWGPRALIEGLNQGHEVIEAPGLHKPFSLWKAEKPTLLLKE